MEVGPRIRRFLSGIGAVLLFLKGWLLADFYVGDPGWLVASLKVILLWGIAFAIIATL